MSEPDQPRQETEALHERISRLSAAILRTSASLNVGTVLHEVVESARALTGARYGVITTIDAAGELQDFVTSGFTTDEHLQLTAWPDGPRLFERSVHTSRGPNSPRLTTDNGCSVNWAVARPARRALGSPVPLTRTTQREHSPRPP